MVGILFIYGGIALAREFLVILYYRAIFGQSAISGAVLNFLIEVLDFYVLANIVMTVIKQGNFAPAVVYAFFGSLGVFLGIKLKLRGK